MTRERTAFQIEQLKRAGKITDEDLDKVIIDIELDKIRSSTFRSYLQWFIFWLNIVFFVYLARSISKQLEWPGILIDIIIVMVFFSSILIAASGIASTRLIVPGALVVYDTAIMKDIHDAKKRAFNNLKGPIMGYAFGFFFFLIYFIFTNLSWLFFLTN